MKRITAFALSLVLAVGLVGCGASSSSVSSAPAASSEAASSEAASSEAASSEAAATEGEVNRYAQILHDSRPADYNEAYMVIAPGADDVKYVAIDGPSAEYSAEDLAGFVDNMLAPLLGLEAADCADYAYSLSPMNMRSYGVAIVMPAEGKTDAVKAALEAFVEGQKSSMQNYLPDQYEIASAATVTVEPTGEVVLVCCEDGADVLSSIQTALKA